MRVLLDKGEVSAVRDARTRIIYLHCHGISVRLYSKTRLHAKVLLTDVEQSWGSLNWTEASLRNVERNVAVALPTEQLAEEVAWFDELWRAARECTGRESEDQLVTPS